MRWTSHSINRQVMNRWKPSALNSGESPLGSEGLHWSPVRGAHKCALPLAPDRLRLSAAAHACAPFWRVGAGEGAEWRGSSEALDVTSQILVRVPVKTKSNSLKTKWPRRNASPLPKRNHPYLSGSHVHSLAPSSSNQGPSGEGAWLPW